MRIFDWLVRLFAKRGEDSKVKENSPRRAPYDRREAIIHPVSAILTIVPRHQERFFIDTSIQAGNALSLTVYAHSDPPAHIMRYLGADQTKKTLVLSLGRSEYVKSILKRYQYRFRVSDQARGVALSAPVTKVAGIVAYKFLSDHNKEQREGVKTEEPKGTQTITTDISKSTEKLEDKNMNRSYTQMDSQYITDKSVEIGDSSAKTTIPEEIPVLTENKKVPERYDLIVTIVNKGYTDLVMEASRKAGARGGTILTARGTGNPDLEKYYGFSISPEKEIVLIIVERKLSDDVLQSIYDAAGLSTNGQGLAFVIPAGRVAGMTAVEIGESGREEEVLVDTIPEEGKDSETEN